MSQQHIFHISSIISDTQLNTDGGCWRKGRAPTADTQHRPGACETERPLKSQRFQSSRHHHRGQIPFTVLNILFLGRPITLQLHWIFMKRLSNLIFMGSRRRGQKRSRKTQLLMSCTGNFLLSYSRFLKLSSF